MMWVRFCGISWCVWFLIIYYKLNRLKQAVDRPRTTSTFSKTCYTGVLDNDNIIRKTSDSDNTCHEQLLSFLSISFGTFAYLLIHLFIYLFAILLGAFFWLVYCTKLAALSRSVSCAGFDRWDKHAVGKTQRRWINDHATAKRSLRMETEVLRLST